jgi:DNA-binding NarL/FixJ family response regulator
VSRNTIKFHVANILSKLGVHSRFDLPRHWPESGAEA